MKILHTADWHLGVNLYNESLEMDHNLFLDWLTNVCIPETKPDVIIISGDVFDKANPSIYARKQYYQFLANLVNLGIQKIIITAGNHDSPAMLEAPKELLAQLNILVVGSATQNHEELLIQILDKTDKNPIAIIAAVPYLRDQDVRFSQADEHEEMREEALKKGLNKYFLDVAISSSKYRNSGIPIICMGHLYATGVSMSDSERPIQIGNLGNIGADCFPKEYFSYVALGHIHKAQKVEGANHIWYSGSPIALSFSEWDQQKYFRLISIEGSTVESTEIKIPQFRKLIRIKGSFAEVKFKIREIKDTALLPSLLDIEIIEQKYNASLGRDIAQWVEELAKSMKNEICIANYRYIFTDMPKPLSSLGNIKSIEELKPEDVFKNRLDNNFINEEDKKQCFNAFNQILELVHLEEQI